MATVTIKGVDVIGNVITVCIPRNSIVQLISPTSEQIAVINRNRKFGKT